MDLDDRIETNWVICNTYKQYSNTIKWFFTFYVSEYCITFVRMI